MKYCEPCRQRGQYPAAVSLEHAQCEICYQITNIHNVPAMGIPLPGELVTSPPTHDPFLDPPVDPRAQTIQQQRDDMAAGKAASTSLPPNYEALKNLTQWLAENGWDAIQIADAVKRPSAYWPYYQAAQEGGELASGA